MLDIKRAQGMNKRGLIGIQATFSLLPKYISMLVADFGCVVIAFLLALTFCFQGAIPEGYMITLQTFSVIGFLLSSGLMLLVKVYAISIIDFNLLDAIRMGAVMFIGYILLYLLNTVLDDKAPSVVLMNYFFINTLLFALTRIFIRTWHWSIGKIVLNLSSSSEIKNVLIFGAGGAGQYLLNMLIYNHKERRRVVCFLDDNPKLWGRIIKGVRILGGRECIPKVAEQYKVDEIIIAIPHVDNSTIRDIFHYCADANCNIKRFANLTNFTKESLSKATIDDVKLEDLLGRNEVHLNMTLVQELIKGSTVLVTGGAGSIGSEICRQILKYEAERLIIFDFNENGLFEISNELSTLYGRDRFVTVLGSIRDAERLKEVFAQYQPDIVFHAAAHKHVPMMELNPFEAFINNVLGTYNTGTIARQHGVKRFVLISTDKAVNPTNVMGASKRIAELIIQHLNCNSRTIFAAVRFGNVLGSNGSVIPVFRRQIMEGGPVTVTDRNIRRYFMTIPEAVQLVLEASAMSNGSEIFVLNMGEPVMIYDLACTMVRLSGLRPNKDIEIRITGLREGEKLFEEISLDSEFVEKTDNDRIYIINNTDHQCPDMVESVIPILMDAILNRQEDKLFRIVKMLVPTFTSTKYTKPVRTDFMQSNVFPSRNN